MSSPVMAGPRYRTVAPVGVAAHYMLARSATRVDPLVALRAE